MLRLGVDIGGTKINIGVIDENNQIIKNCVYKVCDTENVPNLIKGFLSEFYKETEFSKKDIGCCGIGVPGTVSDDGRCLLKVPNMSLLNKEIVVDTEKTIGIPCTMIQDSRAAAYAEYIMSGKEYKTFVCITLGTGIGTGIVIEGKLYSGGAAGAGELGHIPIKEGTRPCGCGKTGCLENYVAGKGLDKTAKELLGRESTAKDLFAEAERGNKKCISAIDNAVDLLADGITSLINIISPECIVFSGGISKQTKLYVNPLIKKIKQRCYSIDAKPELKTASLGENAPMVGAALFPKIRKREFEISASIMCADILNLGNAIDELSKANVKYLHCDIMDNHFVPNMMIPAEFINKIKSQKDISLDIHIMADSPESIINMINGDENDIITFHYESTYHVQRIIDKIKEKGCRVGIALNPSTPIEHLKEVLSQIDMVLVMTVNPGFAGQKMIGYGIDKIKRTRNYLDSHGFSNVVIEVDGNCSFDNSPKMITAGADILVCGSSSIFNPEFSIAEGVKRLIKTAEE